ncbi:hypothetical protein Sste5346_008964 [Sporothrix stenoceras]|uniref:4'-phosphopantetheinyl transferase domain-containing protein n=1 Tax=Sporothrix stenoceras TaxID=5173 RepID=A0ABR3YPI5_9PEZI
MPPPLTTTGAASRILPFGLPLLHVGTDICHVSRVYTILKKAKPASSTSSSSTTSSPPKQTNAARFIRRVLTPREVEALPALSTVAPESPSTMSAHAAVFLLARGSPLPVVATDSSEDPSLTPLWRAAQFLAGRFAAKEAAIKAHPHLPGLTLQDVRIARRAAAEKTDELDHVIGEDVVQRRNANSGPPLAYVRVYALEKDGDGSDIVEQEARISISHDGEYATAVCLGVQHNT